MSNLTNTSRKPWLYLATAFAPNLFVILVSLVFTWNLGRAQRDELLFSLGASFVFHLLIANFYSLSVRKSKKKDSWLLLQYMLLVIVAQSALLYISLRGEKFTEEQTLYTISFFVIPAAISCAVVYAWLLKKEKKVTSEELISTLGEE